MTQRVEQRIGDVGGRWLLIFRWQKIVADAGDISQARLRRLGQRSDKCDCPIGMASGPMEAARAAGFACRWLADIAEKGGNADIRGATSIDDSAPSRPD